MRGKPLSILLISWVPAKPVKKVRVLSKKIFHPVERSKLSKAYLDSSSASDSVSICPDLSKVDELVAEGAYTIFVNYNLVKYPAGGQHHTYNISVAQTNLKLVTVQNPVKVDNISMVSELPWDFMNSARKFSTLGDPGLPEYSMCWTETMFVFCFSGQKLFIGLYPQGTRLERRGFCASMERVSEEYAEHLLLEIFHSDRRLGLTILTNLQVSHRESKSLCLDYTRSLANFHDNYIMEFASVLPKIVRTLEATRVVWDRVVVKVLRVLKDQQGPYLESVDKYLKRFVDNTSVDKLLRACPINTNFAGGNTTDRIIAAGKNLEAALEVLESVLQGFKQSAKVWKLIVRRVISTTLIELKASRTSSGEVSELMGLLQSLGSDVKKDSEMDTYTSSLNKSAFSPVRGHKNLLEDPDTFIKEMPGIFSCLAKRTIVQNTWITKYGVADRKFGHFDRILSEEIIKSQGFSWSEYLQDFQRMVNRLQERNEGRQYYQGPGCIKRYLWPDKSEMISGGDMYPAEAIDALGPKPEQDVDIFAAQTETDQTAKQLMYYVCAVVIDQKAEEKLNAWIDGGESYPSEVSEEQLINATRDELQEKGFYFYQTTPEPKEVALNVITTLAAINHEAEVKQREFKVVATAELDNHMLILAMGARLYMILAKKSGFEDRELRMLKYAAIMKENIAYNNELIHHRNLG